ncbi:MAG: hypothetical protein PHV49_05485, partial [Alistipes sp.]|nr:hypothetical protein [Alistipes sp.]
DISTPPLERQRSHPMAPPVPSPPRSVPNPLLGQPSIESKKRDEEIDIDDLESRPAFLRRNFKFVKDSAADRSSRVVLKDDPASGSNNEPSRVGSLFD